MANLTKKQQHAGESAEDEYARYTVIESSKTRIEKVKLHLLPRKDNDEENQQEDNREDGE